MKDLLKSDSICQNYAQMKKGSSFLTHSVYGINVAQYRSNMTLLNVVRKKYRRKEKLKNL